jgi:hypothetical protein
MHKKRCEKVYRKPACDPVKLGIDPFSSKKLNSFQPVTGQLNDPWNRPWAQWFGLILTQKTDNQTCM